MKKIICLAVGLLVFTFTPILGKANGAPTPPANTYQDQLRAIVNAASSPQKKPPELTKFNLDFPGGTPAELVKAIEKAMGKPLNAIIPDEDANLRLPPLKMADVNVAQLFAALQSASEKNVSVLQTNPGGYRVSSYYNESYGFQTLGERSDSSIWYFRAEIPPPVISPQEVCRFYSLAPYLDRGFTVDDITTAIQTGWKLAGIVSPPQLEYHKETKLLIAYGQPGQLKTIEDVLHALPKPTPNVWNPLETEKKVMSILNSNSTSPPPSSIKEKSGK